VSLTSALRSETLSFLELANRGGPYWPSHCRPTCTVFVPSSRSPLPSITSTPPPYGAVAGSLSSSPSRRAMTCSGSHRDSEEELRPLHRPVLRPRQPAGLDITEVREWATAQGIGVKDRGRVPAELGGWSSPRPLPRSRAQDIPVNPAMPSHARAC